MKAKISHIDVVYWKIKLRVENFYSKYEGEKR